MRIEIYLQFGNMQECSSKGRCGLLDTATTSNRWMIMEYNRHSHTNEERKHSGPASGRERRGSFMTAQAKLLFEITIRSKRSSRWLTHSLCRERVGFAKHQNTFLVRDVPAKVASIYHYGSKPQPRVASKRLDKSKEVECLELRHVLRRHSHNLQRGTRARRPLVRPQ